MLKKIFLITIINSISIATFSQNWKQFYKAGIKQFDEGHYKAADSLFSLSLKYNDTKNCFYNRAAAKLYLKDTTSYCHDLYLASELRDFDSEKLFYTDCLKSDSVAYSLYKKSLIAIVKSNYKQADSLLTASINELEVYENQFCRAVVKLSMNDTCGYCDDMSNVLFCNDKLYDSYFKLCENYKCKNNETNDTIYYDYYFTKVLKKSNFFVNIVSIKGLNDVGYCMDLNLTISFFARFDIIDSVRYYSKTDKMVIDEDEINDYIRKNTTIPNDLKKLLSGIEAIRVGVTAFYDLKGNIKFELTNKHDLNYLLKSKLKNDSSREKVINELFEDAKKIIINIPAKPKYYLRGNPVNFSVEYKIKYII